MRPSPRGMRKGMDERESEFKAVRLVQFSFAKALLVVYRGIHCNPIFLEPASNAPTVYVYPTIFPEK